MNRRSFLSSILALATAPVIVRAESIMRIKPIILPGDDGWYHFRFTKGARYAEVFTVEGWMSYPGQIEWVFKRYSGLPPELVEPVLASNRARHPDAQWHSFKIARQP